jgi:hypothetical protein
MKIDSILNFDECTRAANSSSTNLRKAEIFISICSKVMGQILTIFERVFVKFTQGGKSGSWILTAPDGS